MKLQGKVPFIFLLRTTTKKYEGTVLMHLRTHAYAHCAYARASCAYARRSVRTHVRMHSTRVRTYTNRVRTHLRAHTNARAYACLRARYILVETKIVDRSDILKNRSDSSSKNRSVNFIVFLYQKSHFQFNQTDELKIKRNY